MFGCIHLDVLFCLMHPVKRLGGSKMHQHRLALMRSELLLIRILSFKRLVIVGHNHTANEVYIPGLRTRSVAEAVAIGLSLGSDASGERRHEGENNTQQNETSFLKSNQRLCADNTSTSHILF